MWTVLAANTAEPSPVVIVGGAAALLGFIMGNLASRSRYAAAKLEERLKEIAFIVGLLGAVAALVAESLALHRHSVLAAIALWLVVVGIAVILLLPKLVGFGARREQDRVDQGPQPVSPSKPPTPGRDVDNDHEVNEHEGGAVEGKVPEPEPQMTEPLGR